MENITQSTNIYLVKNERMGGFVPSWDAPKNVPKQNNFEEALSSYSPLPEKIEIKPTSDKDKFGFLDMVDMVNPLQHIPFVNMAYRSITGDEIRPISKVIGGGIFGGAVGAASSMVSVIIEDATGKDIVDNITSLATNDKSDKEKPQEYQAYEKMQLAQGRTAGSIAIYS